MDLFEDEVEAGNAIDDTASHKDRAQKLSVVERRISQLWSEASGLKYEDHTPQWQKYLRRFARVLQDDYSKNGPIFE